eukprot:1195846-Prorocentrum_minimum.AAC.1
MSKLTIWNNHRALEHPKGPGSKKNPRYCTLGGMGGQIPHFRVLKTFRASASIPAYSTAYSTAYTTLLGTQHVGRKGCLSTQAVASIRHGFVVSWFEDDSLVTMPTSGGSLGAKQ